MLDVSVIIATRRRRRGLLTCLAHLEKQGHPAARYEVIIAGVGSSEETLGAIHRYAEAAPVRTRCLRTGDIGTPSARNLAAGEAEGRWLLFLDSKLFASPNLVQRHLRAQNRFGGNVVVVGAVSPHPQMESGSFNRWYVPDPVVELAENKPLAWHTWRRANMSIPRDVFLGAGGFDPAFSFAQFSDAELGWRLSRQGVQAFHAPEAHAYVFLPTRLEHERRRQYAKGYSLHTLAQRTGDRALLARYSLDGPGACGRFDALLMPFFVRACLRMGEDSRLVARLYPRILRHDLCRGFMDANRGHPPRHFEREP